jgi:TolB protein
LPDATEVIVSELDDPLSNVQMTSSLNNFSPQWSPDGQWLTFVSLRDGNREVYVMTIAGTSQTNLTQSASTDTDPVWQPGAP